MKNIQKILVGLNLLTKQAEVKIAQKLFVSLSCAETTKRDKLAGVGGEKETGHQLCN